MIPPLRKIDPKTGMAYDRQQYQQSLERLYQLPIEEVAERAGITDSDDPKYVPSECVIHFVRMSKENGDAPAYVTELVNQPLMRFKPSQCIWT